MDPVAGGFDSDPSSFIPPEEMILVDPPKTDPVDVGCGVDPSTESVETLGWGDPPNIEAEEVGRDGMTEEVTCVGTTLLVTEVTAFPPADEEVVVTNFPTISVLESETGSSFAAVFEVTTADTVEEPNADTKDVADDPPKLEPIPDPVPKIEAPFCAGEMVAGKPMLVDGFIETDGLELKPFALSVLEAADEEDDPNSDPDPTLTLDLTDTESELEMLVAELPNEKPDLSELPPELVAAAADPRLPNRLLAAVVVSEVAVTATVFTKEEAPKEVMEVRLSPALDSPLGSSFFSGELLAGEMGS